MKSPLPKEPLTFLIGFMATLTNTHSLQPRLEGASRKKCQYEHWHSIQRPAATVSRQTIHRPLSSVFQLFTWETVRQLRLPDLRKYRLTLELRCRHCLCSLKPCPRSNCLISGIAFTAFRLKAVYRQSTLCLIVLMKEQPQGENTAVDFSIPPKPGGQYSISIGQVLP